MKLQVCHALAQIREMVEILEMKKHITTTIAKYEDCSMDINT